MAELGSESSAVQPRNTAKHGRLGPYSRLIDRGAVGGAIDGRSREGRFLRAYEKALVVHVGGNPSLVQRALICRAARLALHLELLDEKTLVEGFTFTKHDCYFYVSWSNALGRLLARLGLDPATSPPQGLADLFPVDQRDLQP